MAGTPYRGGPKSARGPDVSRDDAIRSDPKLLQFWKDRYQESYDAGTHGPDGFAAADKALDEEIARRSKPKKGRAQRRYPVPAANDNEGG